MQRKALVTGVDGQDGSYLAELLLERGYEVHGLGRPRPPSSDAPQRPGLRHAKFYRVEGDLLDHARIRQVIQEIRPDEVYNLAAQSFVPASWDQPVHTAMVDAVGPVVLLEAIRRYIPKARFYQASSSEVFGQVTSTLQDETTYHHPRSPYGAAKSFGMNIARLYRESFGIFACNGILFNHESERRGPHYVTRKITLAAAAATTGSRAILRLGNLDSQRDWGHAADYVHAMWLMLQADTPEDYVVASGTTHSIREFATAAYHAAGIRLAWSGKGVSEIGRDEEGRLRVQVDPGLFRPVDVVRLCGDASKARRLLGWSPAHSFDQLVKRMVDHDIGLARAAAEKGPTSEGGINASP